jgi:hypothetical protein
MADSSPRLDLVSPREKVASPDVYSSKGPKATVIHRFESRLPITSHHVSKPFDLPNRNSGDRSNIPNQTTQMPCWAMPGRSKTNRVPWRSAEQADRHEETAISRSKFIGISINTSRQEHAQG